MQRKQRLFFLNVILTAFLSCLMLSNVQASEPLWTFEAKTPTDITIAKGSSAQITYIVHNQSKKPKNLIMRPIAGVSQVTPCQLPVAGNCTLTLNVNGSALQGNISGGPVLCQQGNNLQCYQPSSNTLNIRLTTPPPIQQFTVTPLAGANGVISPSTAQVVNAGSSLMFTATSNTGFGVNQWLLDGNVVQNGGTIYQLNNIQTNHTVEVTFNQTTLTPFTPNLTLSINSPGSDPALDGNVRVIQIENTGSIPANNVQVSTSGLPTGTLITSNTCIGVLNPAATCNITITPGANASLDAGSNACTTAPGTLPVPTLVTVSADNASSTDINVLVLGYGCIYQGGFLFSVDDTSPNTGSIGGKAAALTDEVSSAWATILDITTADSITDGQANTNTLATPVGQYPAAQACLNKSDQGFADWFLPAICELTRTTNTNPPNCGANNANLYSTLSANGIGGFTPTNYFSSSESVDDPSDRSWLMNNAGIGFTASKLSVTRSRCIRTFTP